MVTFREGGESRASAAALSALGAALAIGLDLEGLSVALAIAAAVLAFPWKRAAPPALGVSLAPSAASGHGLEQLAPLLEGLPEPALLVDSQGRIAGSNLAARLKLEFEARDGQPLEAITRDVELLDAVQAAALDGASRVIDYEMAAHVEEHFKAYVAPVAWGASYAALVVFHDQTALIATERMRADFLANASHELRTPLAALTLLVETLQGHAKGDGAALERFLPMMQAQAERMRRLIDDLLSLSKIELNEHVPPTERVDVEALAHEAVDSLRLAASKRGVTFAIETEDEPPRVVGDRFQLTQVMFNLLDNAVKYSPDGGAVRVIVGAADDREAAMARAGRRWDDSPRIALLTPPPGKSGGYAFLRVEDRGPGIPKRHLPRLAERFYRVEKEDDQRTGTGLGLAIVKHIVNRHRGGMAVESQIDYGTAFGVVFERISEPVWAPRVSDFSQ